MAEEQALAGTVGDEVEGGRCAFGAGGAGGLVDVLDVPNELGAPGGVGGEVVLPASADDGASIAAAETGFIRAERLFGAVEAVDVEADGGAGEACGRDAAGVAGAGALVGIGVVLVEREPDGELGVEVVIDEFDGDAILRAKGELGEDVRGGGVEGEVIVVLLGAGVAEEERSIVVVAGAADADVVVEEAEAADVGAEVDTGDVAAGAGVEEDGSAGGIVAVEGGGWALNDVDRVVGVRVGEVGTAESVGLGDLEAVFKKQSVADAIALTVVGAAQ